MKEKLKVPRWCGYCEHFVLVDWNTGESYCDLTKEDVAGGKNACKNFMEEIEDDSVWDME